MNRIITLKKTILIILLIPLVSQLNAQKTEKFFDFQWKECKPNVARFYSLVVKTDSGYCRKDFYLRERKLQMLGNYKDSLLQIKTGKFYYFYANGAPEVVRKYVNGKREGLWLSFYNNKTLRDSAIYLHDKPIGTSISWHPNGFIADSVYTNEDGSGVSKSWFGNGSISSIRKYSIGHKKDGLWKFYHRNGKYSSLETYYDSRLVDKKYFDEAGIQMNDTTNRDRPARFSDNDNDWDKYLSENLYFPFNQRIINGDKAVVVVSFTVNEDGMIENVFTSVSFSEKFDKIAENVIKESPQWYPAMLHNRRVKCNLKQTVNFQNSRK